MVDTHVFVCESVQAFSRSNVLKLTRWNDTRLWEEIPVIVGLVIDIPHQYYESGVGFCFAKSFIRAMRLGEWVNMALFTTREELTHRIDI
jgi:hypothetical protein